MFTIAHPSSFAGATLLIGVALLSSACAQDKPAESAKAAPTESKGSSEEFPGKDPTRGEISIGLKISEACGITESDAHFAYNSAKVSSSTGAVFDKLVECFTTGPLAGKTMNLVGHADPRGESEYNMVLGGQRSDNVAKALFERSLPEEQAKTTSRGELDAMGEDEAGWAADRKVQILLAE